MNPRFEAFPAVYRAPGLFWHQPGYEFPGVHGGPCKQACRDLRNLFSGFTSGEAIAVPAKGTTFLRRRAYSATRGKGAEIFGFTAAFLRGLRFFSSFDVAIKMP